MDSFEFRDIDGYEGVYQVSECGHVLLLTHRSGTLKAGELMKNQINYLGYATIRLTLGDTRKTFTVHRLVAKAFLGECPEGMEINHKDGNKLNNHYSNLEYITHQENVTHSVENGLWKPVRGMKHGMAKIPDEIIEEIRSRYAVGDILQKDLAEEYGISRSHVNGLVRGLRRKHVE